MAEVQDMDLVWQFARDNSEAAFTELVQRHLNLVYSVARRCTGNDDDARDVAQAVFIILARKAAGLSGKTVLAGWLYETTRFTAARLLRTNARRHMREQEAYMQSTIQEASSDTMWRDLSPLLEEAMGKLGMREREALVLRYFQNKNISEVGTALAISEDAAKKRVSRALEKLQKLFTKRGIHSTTEILAGAISANSIQIAPVGLAQAVTAIALVKGATASTSTLTLIKGALKIMAWTKTKTGVVVGAAAIIAMGTTTVVIKKTFFPAIKDVYFQPNYRYFQNLPRGLFTLRPTHFTTPADGLDYSGETSSPSGEHVTLFMGRNRSFEQLIAKAYGGSQSYMVFPSNLPKGNFDYLSTVLDSRAGEHLQTEIKRKLGYIAAWQQRDTEVFLLKVKRPNSSALKSPNPRRNSVSWQNSQNQLQMRNQSLASLGYEIQKAANVPVVDQTGVPNTFDFDFNCSLDDLVHRDWDSVNTALSSLGLELISTNMPMNMLVVEKVK